jgi:hypothetical protein
MHRQHTLNLIVNNKPIPAFVKANSALLDRFDVKNTDDLVQIWKNEYNIEIKLPNYLVFNSETDLTMFLIKWS